MACFKATDRDKRRSITMQGEVLEANLNLFSTQTARRPGFSSFKTDGSSPRHLAVSPVLLLYGPFLPSMTATTAPPAKCSWKALSKREHARFKMDGLSLRSSSAESCEFLQHIVFFLPFSHMS